jgi:hypothetical protein
MTEECKKHSGHEARIDNVEHELDLTRIKVDAIQTKTNYILGGVFVGWPLVQVILWVLEHRKP